MASYATDFNAINVRRLTERIISRYTRKTGDRVVTVESAVTSPYAR